MGEFDLLDRLAPFLADEGGDLLVGAGDDAAVLRIGGRCVCLTVDVLVEEVHFRRDLSTLEDVGWKAVAVNCSDVAAMAGAPSVALVGLCRPAAVTEREVEQLYEGMRMACQRWGLRLVGGDTVAAGALALSVTVLGDLGEGEGIRRDGARPGDRLVLVGSLGAAAAALAQVAAGRAPDPDLLAVHRRPQALVAAGAALAAHGARALLDVSDGLGADLGHLCAASKVGAVVRWTDLPIAPGVAQAVPADDLVEVACGGGEDFALLAAVPADAAEAAAAAASAADGVPAAVIGEVVEGSATVLRLPDGRERDLAGLGYDHFRPR
jgi:thiamine-monophosphate kinase